MSSASVTGFMISLAVLAGACATSNYKGLSPGAPLTVVPVTRPVAITRDTEIRDGAGVRIGSESTVVGYRDVLSGFAFKQGDAMIDEQDFYHLARDRDGVDAVERARARGRRRNRIGIALTLASTAAAIAVPVTFGRSTAPYAVGQWFITTPIGLWLALSGREPFDQHVLSASRAFQALGAEPPGWVSELPR